MTAAEGIAELRQLIGEARKYELAHPGADTDLHYMVETAVEISRDGIDPVIELRIRRFRRRVELFSAPH